MSARNPHVLVVHPGAELYGSDRVMLESVDGFLDRDWDVTVCLPFHGPLDAELATRRVTTHHRPMPVLRKTHLSGRGVVRLLTATIRSIPRHWRLLRDVRPDVVYASTLTVPLWSLLGWLLRIPVLVHVHEAESAAPRVLRLGLSIPLLLARRVVVNSRFSASVIEEAVPRLAPRCVVVYNGVAGPPTPPDPPRDRLTGSTRLLFLGRISERKGILDIVETLDELTRRGRAVDLDIVGAVFPGYEAVEDELRARIARLGLDHRVHRHGFDPDVWGHLARTDVLVVPSRREEPFGNTAVEGALAARPVVVSDCGGLPEAVDGMHAARAVPAGAPMRLADAIERVIDDWPRFRDAAEADAAHARTRFAPATYRSAIADEVADLFPPGSVRRIASGAR